MRSFNKLITVSIFLGLVVLIGNFSSILYANESKHNGVEVKFAWIPEPPPVVKSAVVYLVLVNHGEKDDYLLKVESNVSGDAGMHETRQENGMVMMLPVKSVPIPAGGATELKPDGFHIMLGGLKQTLKDGDMVNLVLSFKNAGVLNFEIPVRKHKMSKMKKHLSH